MNAKKDASELRRRAYSYVVAAGDAVHHLELALSGYETPKSLPELCRDIIARQRDDGSFGGSRSSPDAGSVPVSARIVELLSRAGEEEAAARGAAWLAARQREDGGFCENPALAAKLKPEWVWFSAENAVTWITGEVALALVTAGGYEREVARARTFLLRARNKDGGWPGQVAPSYPDRTDLWTVPGVVRGLLAAGVAANHDVFAGLGAALARQKDHWRNPIENPLPALMALGRRGTDADVQECLQLLAETQNADGGWPYLAGDESHADPTTAFVTLLAKYGLAPAA